VCGEYTKKDPVISAFSYLPCCKFINFSYSCQVVSQSFILLCGLSCGMSKYFAKVCSL